MSRRRMKGISTVAAVCFVIAPAIQSIAGQTADDIQRLRTAIRAQIDQGHYRDAEAQARALVSTVKEVSSGNQVQIDRAGDLLVEASTKNGHGAEEIGRAPV